MALPKLETPTYTLTLPSTGEEIKYRPFLVKEQKRLLLAQDSKDEDEVIDAMSALIKDCTFDGVNPKSCSLFDAEYIFLRVRGKSVGDKVNVNVRCPDDKETMTPVTIDLSEVEVQMTDDHTNEVQVTDTVKMILRYPLLSDMKVFKGRPEEMIFKALDSCITEIHFGEDIYNKKDISEKELNDFIDSLNTEQFENISKFFETMPKLRHVVEVTNPKTKVKGEILLEGLDSFLE
jgi:hypothetical protein|tara:strand:+ start:1640 stop:2341 length:702 start_codon:yes stop_codon:yes gene_type:complete